jgi:predicted Zn-dependent protease with MMP-like domain
MARDELEDLLTQADSALNDGRPGEAVALARRATRLDPTCAEAFFLEGEAFLEMGSMEEAEPAYRKANSLAPDSEEILCGLGVVLFERVCLEEAESVFERVLGLNPTIAEAHHYLSVLKERHGKTHESTSHRQRAAELAPDVFHPHLQISKTDFDACMEAALLELPSPVQKALQNTPLVVEPFPSKEDLLASSPPLSPEILGLYRGPALSDQSVFDPWTSIPGEIVLYQKNLERAAGSREELLREIRITVLHEIGHLLGLNEGDLDERGLA